MVLLEFRTVNQSNTHLPLRDDVKAIILAPSFITVLFKNMIITTALW